MRVLILHNRYQQAGGEDAVFQAEADLLASRGHIVETLVFDNRNIDSPVEKLKTGLNSFYNPVSAYRVEQAIRDFQPDVMHVHNFFPLASPAVFYIADRNRLPVVQTLHNYRLLCANALFFREGGVCEDCYGQAFPLNGIKYGCYRGSRLQTAALTGMTALHHRLGTWRKRVNQYIVLSEFARQKLVGSHLQIDAARISIKPNFLFDPGDGDIQIRENYLLFVGRLSAEKGIIPFLEAALPTGLPVKIAGTGPLEEQIRNMSQAHPQLEVLGFQEKPAVLDLLRKARALVFPSTWFEGFPVILLEAIATGTPVIASRLGGIPEIIQDRQNGLLFEAGNIQQMTNAIKLISQENILWSALCSNARETYQARYTPEQNYKMLMEIYEQAIRGPRAEGDAGRLGILKNICKNK